MSSTPRDWPSPARFISSPPRPTAASVVRRGLAMLGMAIVLGACGGGDDDERDPLALDGKPSDRCSQAIAAGHNDEGAGRPAPFLPSVRECESLAAWVQAAKDFGIDLKGREPQFVDNTCNAADADVKALKICQEARAAVADPRRIP